MIPVVTCVLALGLATCGWFVNSRGYRYDDVRRTPRTSDHPIPIIADPGGLDRPYVIIGMVQADPGSMAGIADRELQEGLRQEARKMGGDALINLQRKSDLRGHAVDPGRHANTNRESIRFMWVAEVISYDIPEAAPGAMRD